MRLTEIKNIQPQFFTKTEDIIGWLEMRDIKRYVINEDLTVDVEWNVNLVHHNFEYLPVKFNRVMGDFDISGNPSLMTLEGSPRIVDGNFVCSNCPKLTSLEGSPDEVDKVFTAMDNIGLITTKGITQHVDGIVLAGCKNLTTLEDMPHEIYGIFSCAECHSLKSLKGSPRIVHGSFFMNSCGKIESFNDAPDEIHGRLEFANCPRIKNYLRLLQIKKLTRIDSGGLGVQVRIATPAKIINRYLPEGDIFDCQQELMDAGFEEYAEL